MLDIEIYIGIGVVIATLITAIFNYKRAAKKSDVKDLSSTCDAQQKEIDNNRQEMIMQRSEMSDLRSRINDCESDRTDLREEIINLKSELLDALLERNKNKEAHELSIRQASHILELKDSKSDLEKKLANVEKELADLRTQYAEATKKRKR